jgi:hypothetical protein
MTQGYLSKSLPNLRAKSTKALDWAQQVEKTCPSEPRGGRIQAKHCPRYSSLQNERKVVRIEARRRIDGTKKPPRRRTKRMKGGKEDEGCKAETKGKFLL